MKRMIFLAPFAFVAFLVFVGLGGVLVMLLWNWLVPALFGGHAVSFWQALGLLVLCRILFGRSGIRGGRSRLRRRMRERWGHLTPEERERFRQKMRERWGFGASG